MQRVSWRAIYTIAAAVIAIQVLGLALVIWFDTWRGPLPW